MLFVLQVTQWLSVMAFISPRKTKTTPVIVVQRDTREDGGIAIITITVSCHVALLS